MGLWGVATSSLAARRGQQTMQPISISPPLPLNMRTSIRSSLLTPSTIFASSPGLSSAFSPALNLGLDVPCPLSSLPHPVLTFETEVLGRTTDTQALTPTWTARSGPSTPCFAPPLATPKPVPFTPPPLWIVEQDQGSSEIFTEQRKTGEAQLELKTVKSAMTPVDPPPASPLDNVELTSLLTIDADELLSKVDSRLATLGSSTPVTLSCGTVTKALAHHPVELDSTASTATRPSRAWRDSPCPASASATLSSMHLIPCRNSLSRSARSYEAVELLSTDTAASPTQKSEDDSKGSRAVSPASSATHAATKPLSVGSCRSSTASLNCSRTSTEATSRVSDAHSIQSERPSLGAASSLHASSIRSFASYQKDVKPSSHKRAHMRVPSAPSPSSWRTARSGTFASSSGANVNDWGDPCAKRPSMAKKGSFSSIGKLSNLLPGSNPSSRKTSMEYPRAGSFGGPPNCAGTFTSGFDSMPSLSSSNSRATAAAAQFESATSAQSYGTGTGLSSLLAERVEAASRAAVEKNARTAPLFQRAIAAGQSVAKRAQRSTGSLVNSSSDSSFSLRALGRGKMRALTAANTPTLASYPEEVGASPVVPIQEPTTTTTTTTSSSRGTSFVRKLGKLASRGSVRR